MSKDPFDSKSLVLLQLIYIIKNRSFSNDIMIMTEHNRIKEANIWQHLTQEK